MSNINCMNFPRILNEDVWERYIGRKLKNSERFLIDDARVEKHFNQELENLATIANSKNLFISDLTPLFGNCLFESILAYKIGQSVEILRQSLAHIMYLFQDYQDFFPHNKSSFKEMFSFMNEIEHVICKDDGKIYKYTYNIMCQDLAKNDSWARLPTQLIMMLISYLYKIEFVVVSNTSDYEHVICAYEPTDNVEVTKLYLGHIGESHYVPLKKKTGDPKEEVVLKYIDAKRNYYKWAIKMWKELNGLSADEDLYS